MPVSSRLPYSLFTQSGQTPVPGLRYADDFRRGQGSASKDAAYERALAVAIRVLRALDLRNVPLPSGLMMITPQNLAAVPVDMISSISEGRDRPSSGNNRLINSIASNGPVRFPLLSAPRSTDRSKAGVLEALARAPKGELGRAGATKKSIASQGAVTSLSPVVRATSSPLPSLYDASARSSKYYDTLVNSREAPALASAINRPVSSHLTALTSIIDHHRPSASSGNMTGLDPLSKLFRSAGEGAPGSRSRKRASTEIEIAAGSAASSALRLPKHASQEGIARVGLPAIWFGSPVDTQVKTASTALSRQREDLQQQAVPPAVFDRSVRRGGGSTRHQAVGTAASTASASVADGGRGETGLTTPVQKVNLAGAVILDGRRLGRLTASSQAREASLPARGPSRVNLRAVPIYSGMQIPS